MIDNEAQARETGANGQEAGQYPVGRPCGAESVTAAAGQTEAGVSRLMEAVIERSNLWSAYQKVVRNGGAPGVDGLTVGSFKGWLKMHWSTVKSALLQVSICHRRYARRTSPSPRAGYRHWAYRRSRIEPMQALYWLALDPIAETRGDLNSYGFRSGRSTAEAIAQCRTQRTESCQLAGMAAGG